MAALSVAITAAAGAADLAAARALISEYFASNSADPDFSRCLVWQHAEAELAGLPGDYAPPRGRLLLARVGAEVAGCIALRPTDGALFVSSRGTGEIGRASCRERVWIPV